MTTQKVKKNMLSRADRERVVRGALADVPQVDYQEELRKLLQAAIIEVAPPEIQAVYKSEELRSEWMVEKEVCIFDLYTHIYMPSSWPRDITEWVGDSGVLSSYLVSPQAISKAGELADKNSAQGNKVRQLGEMLKSELAKLRTREDVMSKLPEFAKYLPPIAQGSDKGDAVTEEFKKHGWGHPDKVPPAE